MRNVTKKISKDGIVTYLIRVSAGYTASGKQIKKPLVYKPSPNMTEKQIEKELHKQVILFEEKVKTGHSIDENIRFADYAESWLAVNKANYAPITYTRYVNLLIRINQSIGHLKLSKIQSMHLKEFYKDLGEIVSRKTGQKLSQQSIKHYHRCISAILATATKEQIIPRNVASSAYMNSPKIERKEPRHMDNEQARTFVELLMENRDIRVKSSLSLLIYSGVRIGELCGLEWSDIDFKNNTISVERSSQYCKGYGMITKEPKNETSKRTIKLSGEVFRILAQYKLWYNQQRVFNGDRWINSNRLFIQDNGLAIYPKTINFWLDKFIKENDLPKLTPHSLRHTFCTLLIANGVDIKTVSAKAGHSRASTTLDIYTHSVKAADEMASQVLDDILTPHKAKVIS